MTVRRDDLDPPVSHLTTEGEQFGPLMNVQVLIPEPTPLRAAEISSLFDLHSGGVPWSDTGQSLSDSLANTEIGDDSAMVDIRELSRTYADVQAPVDIDPYAQLGSNTELPVVPETVTLISSPQSEIALTRRLAVAAIGLSVVVILLAVVALTT
jgi:hypothetical protein